MLEGWIIHDLWREGENKTQYTDIYEFQRSQRKTGLRLIYLLGNSTSCSAQDIFSFIALKLKGNTFPVIAWLVKKKKNAFIRTQSPSCSGTIRRKAVTLRWRA